MSESNCASCGLRAKYDAKPKSLLGRFWKWHIKFCPGWKQYLASLSEDDRKRIQAKYA